MPYFNVKYKYRKPGAPNKTSASFGGNAKQPLEALVVQALQNKHKGCEIEVVEIKWK